MSESGTKNTRGQQMPEKVEAMLQKVQNARIMGGIGLEKVLRGGRQCDEDGTEIIMSRQACHEAADKLIKAEAMAVSAENFIQAIDDLLCIADADLDDEGVDDDCENAVEAKYHLKSMISDFRK